MVHILVLAISTNPSLHVVTCTRIWDDVFCFHIDAKKSNNACALSCIAKKMVSMKLYPVALLCVLSEWYTESHLGSMLEHYLRCWPNVNLASRLVFAGWVVGYWSSPYFVFPLKYPRVWRRQKIWSIITDQPLRESIKLNANVMKNILRKMIN